MTEFRMPSLGSDMEAGTLVEWLVQPGDVVARGDVVAVVETQKGAIEIETFEAGTVRELVAEIGQTLPVGDVLARIDAPGEEGAAAPSPQTPAAPAPEPAPRRPPAPAVASAPPPAAPGLRASPAARKAAEAAGLDIATIHGTGPEGAIRLADVEAAVAHKAETRPAGRAEMSAMRQAVAAAMTRSKREIPHFYVTHSIDTQTVSDWLAARNADRAPSERILLGAVFVKAAALAAAQVGVLNGHYTEDGFRASDHVHAGVAIALRGGGLVAPALEATEEMPLDAVMAGMRDLVTRARSGRLRSSEFTRATITVSSLGEGGAEAMTGVIFPPQVALLTVGSPQVRPWIAEGQVAAREVTTFVLSADHRVCDGRQASKFMTELETVLQDPETL